MRASVASEKKIGVSRDLTNVHFDRPGSHEGWQVCNSCTGVI